MTEGWLLDIYPGKPGEIVVWLKKRDNSAIRLVDHWRPSIYVASNDLSDLKYLETKPEVGQYLSDCKFVSMREKVDDSGERRVLKATLRDARQILQLAKTIQHTAAYGVYRLYNVDIPVAQSFMYEKELFSLGYVEAHEKHGMIHWITKDDIASQTYEIPRLKGLHLDIVVDKLGKVPRNSDPIKSIVVTAGETLEFDKGSEEDKIIGVVEFVRKSDPDMVYTSAGDSILFPYLIHRCQINKILHGVSLSRDPVPPTPQRRRGNSYFSYGRIHYKPTSHRLYGRVHVDKNNTFVYGECDLPGLIEVSRVCRILMHDALRASIGKCMSSLQFYQAVKSNMLIPWKATMCELFKSGYDLLVGDRGGFIFEPKIGMHAGVGEIDFESLYPNIMVENNISAETINCECCPDSERIVPELGYRICSKEGIVPKALKLILKKRSAYKLLMRTETDTVMKREYEARRSALKWILVCCFGYLSFRNAKFGRIDAHMAVCAYARKVLLDAADIAERNGFKVIHGIVDSLWLKKNTRSEDFVELAAEIKNDTGYHVSFEGLYRWICFLESKMHHGVPVLNRYFGVFDDGTVKARGIELRRSDTPKFIVECQKEILDVLSGAMSIEELQHVIPRAIDVYKKYLDAISARKVSPDKLFFTRQLSKDPHEYMNNTLSRIAIKQLINEGVELSAGENIRYIIRDRNNIYPWNRVSPVEFAMGEGYDADEYVKLLRESVEYLISLNNHVH